MVMWQITRTHQAQVSERIRYMFRPPSSGDNAGTKVPYLLHPAHPNLATNTVNRHTVAHNRDYNTLDNSFHGGLGDDMLGMVNGYQCTGAFPGYDIDVRLIAEVAIDGYSKLFHDATVRHRRAAKFNSVDDMFLSMFGVPNTNV